MNILDAQLYHACINNKKNIAMVAYCNVELQQTLIRTFKFENGTCVVLNEKIFSEALKFVVSYDNHWLYISQNDDAHSIVKNSWDTLDVVSEMSVEGELFRHNMVVSADEALFALATFEGKTVNIFETKQMKRVGIGKANHTPYVQALNFSASGNDLGFVNFDQGGGHSTWLKKSGNEFSLVQEITGIQFKDDVNMNANLVFNGDDMIVTVVDRGQFFHTIRYDKNGNKVWNNEFTSVLKLDLSEEKIRFNAYQERIWNQQHTAVLHKDNLYLGANGKIHVLDSKTGTIVKTLSADVKGFVHQLHLSEPLSALFVLDCLGNTSLVSLNADSLEGKQWYLED